VDMITFDEQAAKSCLRFGLHSDNGYVLYICRIGVTISPGLVCENKAGVNLEIMDVQIAETECMMCNYYYCACLCLYSQHLVLQSLRILSTVQL